LLPYAGFGLVLAGYIALRVNAIGQFAMLRETTAFAADPE
jgi:hypothetical protein